MVLVLPFISRQLADEPLGDISVTEFEEARRDPKVLAMLANADKYLAELERQGRSR